MHNLLKKTLNFDNFKDIKIDLTNTLNASDASDYNEECAVFNALKKEFIESDIKSNIKKIENYKRYKDVNDEDDSKNFSNINKKVNKDKIFFLNNKNKSNNKFNNLNKKFSFFKKNKNIYINKNILKTLYKYRQNKKYIYIVNVFNISKKIKNKLIKKKNHEERLKLCTKIIKNDIEKYKKIPYIYKRYRNILKNVFKNNYFKKKNNIINDENVKGNIYLKKKVTYKILNNKQNSFEDKNLNKKGDLKETNNEIDGYTDRNKYKGKGMKNIKKQLLGQNIKNTETITDVNKIKLNNMYTYIIKRGYINNGNSFMKYEKNIRRKQNILKFNKLKDISKSSSILKNLNLSIYRRISSNNRIFKIKKNKKIKKNNENINFLSNNINFYESINYKNYNNMDKKQQYIDSFIKQNIKDTYMDEIKQKINKTLTTLNNIKKNNYKLKFCLEKEIIDNKIYQNKLKTKNCNLKKKASQNKKTVEKNKNYCNNINKKNIKNISEEYIEKNNICIYNNLNKRNNLIKGLSKENIKNQVYKNNDTYTLLFNSMNMNNSLISKPISIKETNLNKILNMTNKKKVYLNDITNLKKIVNYGIYINEKLKRINNRNKIAINIIENYVQKKKKIINFIKPKKNFYLNNRNVSYITNISFINPILYNMSHIYDHYASLSLNTKKNI